MEDGVWRLIFAPLAGLARFIDDSSRRTLESACAIDHVKAGLTFGAGTPNSWKCALVAARVALLAGVAAGYIHSVSVRVRSASSVLALAVV